MPQFIDAKGLYKPAPVGFRQIARVGNLAFLSGQTAQAEDGSLVGAGDMEAQCERVMQNLNACLEALGVDYHAIAKTTMYYTDREILPVFRAVRRRYWPDQDFASTGIMVAGLNDPGYMLEVEAVIEMPG